MNIFFRILKPLVDAMCICLLCCVPIFSSDNVSPSSLHPFNPKVLSSKGYCEVYKLTALYDDHTFIQTQMIVTNIGIGDSNAACEMIVLHSGEKPNKTNKRFKKSGWKFSDGPDPTLSFGPCFLTQEGESTRCVMALDSTMADIILDRPPRTGISPDTILADNASKKFFFNDVLIPWTRLRTTLHLPGCPKKQLQGFGMLEHARSVGFPKDFSRGWVWFYGYRESSQFLACFHFPTHPVSGAIGWTWTSPGQAPHPMAGLQMVMKPTNNHTNENGLPFVTGPNSSFIIDGRQSLFRLTLIDDLGPFLGYISRFFVGNPVARFYWAQAQISPGQAPIEGILEIMNFE